VLVHRDGKARTQEQSDSFAALCLVIPTPPTSSFRANEVPFPSVTAVLACYEPSWLGDSFACIRALLRSGMTRFRGLGPYIVTSRALFRASNDLCFVRRWNDVLVLSGSLSYGKWYL